MANDKGVSGKESGRGLGGGVITREVREIEPVRPCHVKVKVMVALSLSYGFTQKSDGGIGIVRGGPLHSDVMFQTHRLAHNCHWDI